MRQELVKVYGSLTPADDKARIALEEVCRDWNTSIETELVGDLLRFSFEGVWFPGDEAAEALEPFLSVQSSARIDMLDLEAWTLTRYLAKNGKMMRFIRDLNHVLDYSGH